jgi:hypothetical protein
MFGNMFYPISSPPEAVDFQDKTHPYSIPNISQCDTNAQHK